MSLNKKFGLSMAVIMLAAGLISFAGWAQTNFSDVPQSHWAHDDVKYLAQRGIVTGLPGGEYEGDEAITRYQVATLVSRALKYMRNNPQSVAQGDISTLEDLAFKLSERVEQNRNDYKQLQAQVQGFGKQIDQLQAASGPSENYEQLVQRSKSNFILGVAGLVVGAAALVWSVL